MSLINKVLKDIDNRQQTSGRHGKPGSAVAQAEPSRWRWISIVLAALLVLLSVFLLWPEPQQQQTLSEEPKVTEQELTEEQPTAAKETADEQAENTAEPTQSDAQPPEPRPKPASRQQTVTVSDTSLQQLLSDADPQSRSLAAEEDNSPAAAKTPTFTKQPVTLTPHEIAERALEKAKVAQQRGLFSEAAEHYQQALEAKPNFHDARKEWAALEFGRGQISQALSILREGLAGYPQAHSLRLLAATILERQGQPQLALRLLQQQQPDAAQLTEYYQLQAELAQQQQNLPLMESSYRTLSQAEPDNGRWYLGLALSLRQAKPQQALTAFEKAASLIEHQPTLEFIAQQIQALRSQHEATTP